MPQPVLQQFRLPSEGKVPTVWCASYEDPTSAAFLSCYHQASAQNSTWSALPPGGIPEGLPRLGRFPEGKVRGMPLVALAALGVSIIRCQGGRAHCPRAQLPVHVPLMPAAGRQQVKQLNVPK